MPPSSDGGAIPTDCGPRPETCSYAATHLLGRALSSLKLHEEGPIATARLTAKTPERGRQRCRTEGIVNHLRAIAAQIALLLREVNGKVRISLRSREPVDVAEIAREFGGGGHRAAAGCTIALPIAQAEDRLLAAARRGLQRAHSTPCP